MDFRDLPSLAAALLALDARGVGGICLRGPSGPARDGWLEFLRSLLPPETPMRKLPMGVTADRLLGGPDLAATLAQGRRVVRGGVVHETHGGILLVPSLERVTLEVASALLGALDHGQVHLEREGCSAILPAAVALVGMDESRDDEEGPPRALLERIGIQMDLPARWTAPESDDWISAVSRARTLLLAPSGQSSPDAEGVRTALARSSLELGISSLRPLLHTFRATQLVGALMAEAAGDRNAGDPLPLPPEALSLAGALILLPRAIRIPADNADLPEELEGPPPPEPEGGPPEPEEELDASPKDVEPAAESQKPPPEADPPRGQDEPDPSCREEVVEIRPDQVVPVARALLPADWQPWGARGRTLRGQGGGRAGDETEDPFRGRRKGVRPGDPKRRRIDLGATLRAAAPWQGIRGREPGGPVRIEAGDIRIQIRVRPLGTRTIFVVDASGSQALRRLGEVKGAVELLLAESYRSREEVALVVFRDRSARTLVPPTRSLTRAKRLLRGMAGGGGTPMALGLEEALGLARSGQRDGKACRILLLSDGRPNVDRAGRGGRRAAMADALAIAGEVGRMGVPLVVLDTSPRGTDYLEELAGAGRGRAYHLPRADARRIRDRVNGEAWA